MSLLRLAKRHLVFSATMLLVICEFPTLQMPPPEAVPPSAVAEFDAMVQAAITRSPAL